MLKISKTLLPIKISPSVPQKALSDMPKTSTKPSCEIHNNIINEVYTNYAHTISHLDNGGTLVFGDLPPNYKKLVSKEYIEESTYVGRFGKNKGKIITTPGHYKENYESLAHYYIDKIYTTGKGSGTNSIKAILKKSLSNPKTQGRVMLDASCIDGKTSPAGFYYKLGFRFADPISNKECEKWLQQGGNRNEAPFCSGLMYMPKENISHCLNYIVK